MMTMKMNAGGFGYSSNLSRGGIFIQTDKLVAVGTVLTVQFSLPNNPKNIRTEGRVIRTTSGSSKQKPGMAIEFLTLRRDDEALISNFIKMMGSAKPSKSNLQYSQKATSH